MSAKPYRKPGLLDAMILVAATAPALAALRHHWPPVLDWSGLVGGLISIGVLFYGLSPLAAMWTLACLVIRLRRPRPIFRRMIRQPGTTATLAALFVLAIEAATLGMKCGVLAGEFGLTEGAKYFDMEDGWQGIPADVGLTVAAVWFLQTIAGGWRSEPTWIDRMGRALGVFWLATIPFGVLTAILER